MTEITNITSAFSADQVVRLTSLSMRQLAYWDIVAISPASYSANAPSLPPEGTKAAF